MKNLLIALLLLASPVVAQERVSVYVFTATDPSGFVDADSTARMKTVAETKKRIAKSKHLSVAETAEGATITLEITGTSVGETKNTLAGLANDLDRLNGGIAAAGANRKETEKVLQRHATLRVGAYSTDLEARAGSGKQGNSIISGSGLASAVEAWVKQNQAKLTRQ